MRLWAWGVVAAGLAAAVSWGGGQLAARAAQTVLADLAAQGRGGAETVAAAGFPLRLGLRVQGLSLQEPAQGLAWSVPQAQASAPLWAPLSWRADLGLPQQVTLAGHPFRLEAGVAQADLGLGLGVDLPLRRAGVRLAAPRLIHVAALAPSLAAESLWLDLAQEGAAYALQVEATGLALPSRLAAALTPETRLPDVIERLSGSARLGFAAPLALVAKAPPQIETIEISASELLWGGHRLQATGRLQIGAAGTPEGTILLATPDWQAWLEVAVAGGGLPRERLAMMQGLGRYLAAQHPEGMVQVPLVFAAGRMSLGPVPLGAAPRLR